MFLATCLVVHLKRFGETGGGRRVKRTARVDFPWMMDLGAFSGSHLQDEEACVYDLVATVDHLGGLNGGPLHSGVSRHARRRLCEGRRVVKV